MQQANSWQVRLPFYNKYLLLAECKVCTASYGLSLQRYLTYRMDLTLANKWGT